MMQGTSFGYFKACFRAMGSPCELLLDTTDPSVARDALALARGEVGRIERKLSRYRHDSLVGELNRANGMPARLDAETAALLDLAAGLYERSDGLFDITCGALRDAWTFDGRQGEPAGDLVAALLRRVGWHKVRWHAPTLRLPAGMEIDLGGIGKEYAADRVAALLAARDLRAMVNLGGDVVVTGPRLSGAPWLVGVEPAKPGGDGPARTIELLAGAVATSGDTRRYVVVNGERRGHILDPRSGWPLRDAPHTVTVRAETCTAAGALAQLAMLSELGAERFLDGQGAEHWCAR